MCFHLAISEDREEIENTFQAEFDQDAAFAPIYHTSAFTTPYLPVICGSNTSQIQFLQWGLVPFWVKDSKQAAKIRFGTFNARSETVFEKPSFKHAVKKQRCLVLASGFYEWQELEGQKYPYFIQLRQHKLFALAGIWDEWHNKATGEKTVSFSIITTQANPMMSKIHNSKKRMPVILSVDSKTENSAKQWLNPDITKENTHRLMLPYADDQMQAHTISRLITSRKQSTNIPAVQQAHSYDAFHRLF